MVAFSKSAALAAVAFLAAVGEAHMMMKTPTPYGKSTLNNSPLDASGSDFPCKIRPGGYDAEGASNVASIGETQTLSFIGGATHSGGSCQIALSLDGQPTKDSKWMVIKSIIGGCPSDVEGNLSGDPAGTGASTFDYVIPAGIAPGDYTLAWSWFNKVGNREMYMNCAPMTVTAAKKKRYAPAPKVSKRQSTFPDLFVANVDNHQCNSPDSADLVFPDPGSVVQTAGKGPFSTATCNLGKGGATGAAQPTGVSSAGSGVSPTIAPTASATGFAGGNSGQYSQASGGQSAGSASVPTPTPVASTSADNTQVIPVTTSTGQTFTPAATPISSNTAAPSGTAPASPAVSGSTGATGQLSGPCSQEGAYFCLSDGSSFQRCASGAWSVPIPLGNLRCTPGESMDFAMTAAKAKRFES